jgi:hypothetical protein
MDDLIKKLTAEQALEVVKRLSEKGGEIREVVLLEVKTLLMAVDVNETAAEVFCVLDIHSRLPFPIRTIRKMKSTG